MVRARDGLRRVLFRHGWDTRSRHALAARLLTDAIAGLPAHDGPVLLDVGSGSTGMAAFLTDVDVMGVDLEPPDDPPPNLSFTQSSIADLPFGDRSFPYVSCIDVLQALGPEIRRRGLEELLRVARDGVLIATPQGRVAARCDAEFERLLLARNAAVPPWVPESRAHPYPTLESIIEAIQRADPNAEVAVSYNEPESICRVVRAAAARSDLLYAAANLLFGLLLRAIPEPEANHGYRVIVFAKLSNPGRLAGPASDPRTSV